MRPFPFDPVPLPAGTCKDPNDVHILGAALAACAGTVVTRDRELKALSNRLGFCILHPAEYVYLHPDAMEFFSKLRPHDPFFKDRAGQLSSVIE